MKTLNILFILPVLLQAQQATPVDVKCYSDFIEDGFAINEQCQVSFKLSSDNGCPVVTSDAPRYSSVGLRPETLRKSLEPKSEFNPYENNCHFNHGSFAGNFLVCRCDIDLCNKNREVIMNILVSSGLELSDECKVTFFEEVWNKLEYTPTKKSLPSKSVPISCLDSSSGVSVVGDVCTTSFNVIPLTCYIIGKPILSARNESRVQCNRFPKNTLQINCYSDKCNGDIDILKEQIADGINVVGDPMTLLVVDCKKQLEISIDSAMSTKKVLIDRTPSTTIAHDTSMSTKEIPSTNQPPPRIPLRIPQCPADGATKWFQSQGNNHTENPLCYALIARRGLDYNGYKAACNSELNAIPAPILSKSDSEAVNELVAYSLTNVKFHDDKYQGFYIGLRDFSTSISVAQYHWDETDFPLQYTNWFSYAGMREPTRIRGLKPTEKEAKSVTEQYLAGIKEKMQTNYSLLHLI